MIIKVGGGLEPLGPIGVYAYANNTKKHSTAFCHNYQNYTLNVAAAVYLKE